MTIFSSELAFPRSNNVDRSVLAELHGTAPDAITAVPFGLRHAEFHQAGGTRVSADQLADWRDDLNDWAYARGFPAKLTSSSRPKWDVQLGLRLIEDTADQPEGDDPAIWCWIATHLLPHFVVYRWGWPELEQGSTPKGRVPWARFGSSDKNGLLMARQRVLVYGADLAGRASEQEFQSIQYRPAFGIDRRVARAILETLVEAAEDPGSRYGREGSTRSADADDVCVELRVVNSLRPLCYMDDARIRSLVLETIEKLPQIRDPRKEVHRRADREIEGQEKLAPVYGEQSVVDPVVRLPDPTSENQVSSPLAGRPDQSTYDSSPSRR